MDELFRYFFGLHKRTKFFTILLAIALVFPALYVIVYVYFEEYMKYNLLNIIVLSMIVNIYYFVWIFILSSGVMEALQRLEYLYYYLEAKLLKKTSSKDQKLSEEVKSRANSDMIDINLMNASVGLIFTAIVISLKYGSSEAAELKLNTINLLSMFSKDIYLATAVIGFMNYRTRRKMYRELINENNVTYEERAENNKVQ